LGGDKHTAGVRGPAAGQRAVNPSRMANGEASGGQKLDKGAVQQNGVLVVPRKRWRDGMLAGGDQASLVRLVGVPQAPSPVLGRWDAGRRVAGEDLPSGVGASGGGCGGA
jgi:sulfur carrier protein ThiS